MKKNEKDRQEVMSSSDVNVTASAGPDLKSVGASKSPNWNKMILLQTCGSVSHPFFSGEMSDGYNAVLAGLEEIAPRDTLEAMLGAELIATHNAAMDCIRISAAQGQNQGVRMNNLAMANKLSRTFATLLSALNKHRGKGTQKVTVEHVHVNKGGQAIVGSIDIEPGGEKT